MSIYQCIHIYSVRRSGCDLGLVCTVAYMANIMSFIDIQSTLNVRMSYNLAKSIVVSSVVLGAEIFYVKVALVVDK